MALGLRMRATLPLAAGVGGPLGQKVAGSPVSVFGEAGAGRAVAVVVSEQQTVLQFVFRRSRSWAVGQCSGKLSDVNLPESTQQYPWAGWLGSVLQG